MNENATKEKGKEVQRGEGSVTDEGKEKEERGHSVTGKDC